MPCERVTLAGRKREVSEVPRAANKPKFAEHYHGSTDITFPEGTRGKYTRDSMPISATQYALVDLACSVSHPEVPDAVRNTPDRRR